VKTKETKVARQYRIQQWAEQIRECNNRSSGSVKDWCNQHNITTANFYYRLREVRKACLANLPMEQVSQQIVPVPATLTTTNSSVDETYLEVMTNNVCIRVTENTSPELLKMVLQVTADVK
jgi:hypothetical protein